MSSYESLADLSSSEKCDYLEDEVFSDVIGVEVREVNGGEWGDFICMFDDDVEFLGENHGLSLEAWATKLFRQEEEFFFEKVMYKHPRFRTDSVCVSFESIEDNVFRDS